MFNLWIRIGPELLDTFGKKAESLRSPQASAYDSLPDYGCSAYGNLLSGKPMPPDMLTFTKASSPRTQW